MSPVTACTTGAFYRGLVTSAAEKTRHAVQMALVARALVREAQDGHRKRVLGRYVFVYLHDVVRFGPAWRNEVRARGGAACTAAAAAAQPALERLRHDWEHYQDVRHYIGAKRQPRDPKNPAVDEFESFRLWAQIGELSVETLVDDAVEFFSQLAAVSALLPIEYEPKLPDAAKAALADLDPVGEEGRLEAATTSFGATRANAYTIRMGGEAGRIVPLINDIAENLQTLRALVSVVAELSVFDRFLRCQLPAELDELLRLSVGSPNQQADAHPVLLRMYSEPKTAAGTELEGLRDSVSEETRLSLRDWRDRLGAHIDAETPWPELEEGIEHLDLDAILGLLDNTCLWLESAACQPGGPLPLLLPARYIEGAVTGEVVPRPSLGYDDVDAPDSVGAWPTARPPAELDSASAVYVRGPQGHFLSAAVAGIAAGRARDLRERLEALNRRR
ncbi:MAG TPA: hypothetical protein VIJ39_07885 [Solirubrobacteraceae bacterium]